MAAARRRSQQKPAASKEVAVKDESTAIANWDDELSKYAKEYSDRAITSGGSSFISTRGGSFTYKENDLGDAIRVIVLDYAFDNAYYMDMFDPDNPSAPDCFALSLTKEDLTPHESIEEPECETCSECWANKFKSDARRKGKACKNNVRLAVISVDDEFNDITVKSEIALLRLAPTSIKAFDTFRNKVSNVLGIPPFAVAVDLVIEDDDTNTYFTVTPDLETIERVPNELLPTVLSLHKECKEALLTPYSLGDDDEEDDAPPARQQRGRNNNRKPAAKKKAAAKKPAEKASSRKTAPTETSAKDTKTRKPVRRSSKF